MEKQSSLTLFSHLHPIHPLEADHHEQAEMLLGLGAAAPVQLPYGERAWAVTDHALATRLFGNPLVAGHADALRSGGLGGESPGVWNPQSHGRAIGSVSAHREDECRRLHRLAASGLSAERLAPFIPDIERLAHNLLADIAPHPRETVDLRARFAVRLPCLVTGMLLGVTAGMRDLFHGLTTGQPHGTGSGRAALNRRTVHQLLGDLIEVKRAQPGKDLTTQLIEAHDVETGTRLSQPELLSAMKQLLDASKITANILDHGIVNLLRHPDQLRLVRDHTATWNDVVEETLRHQPPVVYTAVGYVVDHITDEPTGEHFLRGELITANLAAIGRDPDIHRLASNFDITRPTRSQHLSLGYGHSRFLGADLARTVARVTLRVLFESYPELALAEPGVLHPQESYLWNAHRSLPSILGTGPAGQASRSPR
ncbi:cytochrome P450 [Streptomyces sp. NPDC056987]|uniref:cytochrome P450 n=1 Tax=Streptomyces sp. NPDC056987 TaxID=3345988 RepID=UPI00362C46CF